MKAILISIHSQWVEKILIFIKKDEIRKGTAIGKAINRLIKEQGVAPTFIYCTKDRKLCLVRNNVNGKYHLDTCYWDEFESNLNGKVVARFNATAEEITPRFTKNHKGVWYITENKNFEELCIESCLCSYQLNDYLQCKKGTTIHINDLEIFDKPKEISEFHKVGYENCAEPQGSLREKVIENYNNALRYQLTRAPESWCYVEV